VICGLHGDDAIDEVRGGRGADLVGGGASDDDVEGGQNRDAVNGDGGSDPVQAGRGNDFCAWRPRTASAATTSRTAGAGRDAYDADGGDVLVRVEHSTPCASVAA
jgi:hypothetical protein